MKNKDTDKQVTNAKALVNAIKDVSDFNRILPECHSKHALSYLYWN